MELGHPPAPWGMLDTPGALLQGVATLPMFSESTSDSSSDVRVLDAHAVLIYTTRSKEPANQAALDVDLMGL